VDPSSASHHAWLQGALAHPGFAHRLARIGEDGGGLVFPGIDEAAHAWLLAVIAAHHQAAGGDARLWVRCDRPRHRERLADELTTWDFKALVLPDPADSGPAGDDAEGSAERLAVLAAVNTGGSDMVIGSGDMFESPAPAPGQVTGASRKLTVGDTVEMTALVAELEAHGYDRAERVESRGHFATRGGIVDLFPWQATSPLRIEWFDDEIESLREFEIHTQQSQRRCEQSEFLLAVPDAGSTVASFMQPGDLVVSVDGEPEGGEIRSRIRILTDAPAQPGAEDDSCACVGQPVGTFEAGDFILAEALREGFFAQLDDWREAGWRIAMVFANRGEEERFEELAGRPLDEDLGVVPLHGELLGSFSVPSLRLAMLSSSEIFGRYRQPGAARRGHLDRQRAATVPTSAEHIREGELVVHSEYGIGRFVGTQAGDEGEELVIEYRDGAQLEVPIDQAHLVGRYIGLGGRTPDLAKLGSGAWKKARQAAETSILDYAARLLRVQAERQSQPGLAHPPDSRWMWEFENSFHFTETPDQQRSIAAVKKDMESAQPMDRLICGDVGFGKTEVAIRAAFKAVTGGRQAAILVPTTVLAEQHWRTFRERMSDYPVRIDLLNRFRTPAQVRSTIAGLADGSVDIVIGTHRLISSDVHFKQLGLIVIDEEQRFGVKHKEKFKDLFRQIDVLTLSATPIPRTLYLALMGARDMSTIDTPPPNRVPVNTTVAGYDERMIRDAIERELEREGQVFFLHNRVKSIEGMRKRLSELVPEARIVVGHGQMEKHELEAVMRTFVRGDADILLATTIIETGIDIPNANTILIDRADRFGLADLYQLRGRVGRRGDQAYAILLLPRDLMTVGDARKRVNAIKQYTALGSGFKIAMRDLEIRGAGNLLGTRQSGHIVAVGFDLYCQLLRQSVDRLSGHKVRQRISVPIRADFISFHDGGHPDLLPAWLPTGWLPEARLRVSAYRELAELAGERELDQLAERWEDRFGRLPDPVRHLIEVNRLRVLAADRSITAVEIRGQRLMLTRNGESIMLAGRRFPRLRKTNPEAKLAEAIHMLRGM
jgi:transcription-repair coupling factor (superfamily II helicase)